VSVPCGNIRVAREADGAQILAIYAPNVRDAFVSFELEVPSLAEMRERIAATLASHPWLVWEEGENVLGYAYGSRHRERLAYQWSVDVSCYVHPDARGRGVGKSLYSELLRVLRGQGFRNAYAGIALPNAASVRLHESVGFEPIGVYRGVGFKRGEWRDVGWWHRRLGALDAAPDAPRPFTGLG
jgi:phosphinothricin acetyltransferase